MTDTLALESRARSVEALMLARFWIASQSFYRWLADATARWLDAVRSQLADDAASPNGAT